VSISISVSRPSTADGKSRDVDPAAYLAEIGQKGNIQLQALHNGNDLSGKV
jgi:hypothetical protein